MARNAGVELESRAPRPSRGIKGELMWPRAGILNLLENGFWSRSGEFDKGFDTYSVANEQALRDALAVGKGRKAYGKERECKQTFKTRAKGNDVITNVISTNQHFASTFSNADAQIPET